MKDRHAPVNRHTKCVQRAEQRGERPVNFFPYPSLHQHTHTASQMHGRGSRIRKVLHSPRKLQ
jgi:hypothetical protein